MKHWVQATVLAVLALCYLVGPAIAADTAHDQQGDITLMQQFDTEEGVAAERAISDERKHEILFFMGAALLLLLLTTGGLGLAMGVFEKDVFVWHMLSAGLTITLALVHAVVSFVWFYPK